MATERKSYEDKLADIEEKEKQLKEQKKRLIAQHSQAERKKRTKRLIELGGAVCKVLNESTVEGDVMNDTDVSDLIRFLQSQNDRGDYFTKAMHRTPKKEEDKLTSTIKT